MNMIEAMTGAANAQDEVVEECYEKSGAFIGVLSGVALGGISVSSRRWHCRSMRMTKSFTMESSSGRGGGRKILFEIVR